MQDQSQVLNMVKVSRFLRTYKTFYSLTCMLITVLTYPLLLKVAILRQETLTSHFMAQLQTT
jgi:hypothetical protein